MSFAWLGDSVGTVGTRIEFSGKSEPYPFVEPYYQSLGSTHTTLAGWSASGQVIRQDAGVPAQGILRVHISKMDIAMKNAIDAYYRAWSAGARPLVQFNNTVHTWLCHFVDFKAIPWTRMGRNDPVSYTGDLELLIKQQL